MRNKLVVLEQSNISCVIQLINTRKIEDTLPRWYYDYEIVICAWAVTMLSAIFNLLKNKKEPIMAKNENRTTNDVMIDNELMVCDVKTWMGIQIGDYRNKFRTHIDSINYQTLDELKQETENYIKSNPLIFTVSREENKIDEIEQWKNIFEDRVAIHGESILSIVEEDLQQELIEEMSVEELDDLIACNIDFFNTYPIDTLYLTETEIT